jgi:tetratricopeptide (TPR) repeat protein
MRRGFGSTQLIVLAAVVGALVLGAVQGARLDDMREVERAYRWTLTAASFSAFGESLELDTGDGEVEPLDDELFAKLVKLGETALPDVPTTESDIGEDGTPLPRLVRAVRQGVDKPVYNMLTSGQGREIVDEFLTASKEGRIASTGSQFTTSALYDTGGQAEGVGITSLFFGLRKVAANFLWMQVDQFWHAGQMHRMVPAMRTTVALDPQFVDAYLLGAWHLAYNLTAHLPDTPEPQKVFHPKYKKRLGPKEEWYYIAADFLLDGIKKNPRQYKLYFDLGYAIHEIKLKDHANAVKYLREARRYPHDKWVERMLYLALWRNGQYDEAIEGWRDYLKTSPDNYAANRFLKINRAYLAEAKSDQAAECAAAARTEAERLRGELESAAPNAADDLRANIAEAERIAEEMDAMRDTEWEKAKAIYDPMSAEDDSIAVARLLRHTALQYAREGRYMEAVMKLELARYEMLENFDELSNLMIRIKQEGNIPLAVTEELALERQKEAAAYAEPNRVKPKRFVECKYAHEEGSLGI